MLGLFLLLIRTAVLFHHELTRKVGVFVNITARSVLCDIKAEFV